MLPLIFDSYYFIQQAVTIWIQGGLLEENIQYIIMLFKVKEWLYTNWKFKNTLYMLV